MHLRLCDFGLAREFPPRLDTEQQEHLRGGERVLEQGGGEGAPNRGRNMAPVPRGRALVGGSPRYMAPECHGLVVAAPGGEEDEGSSQAVSRPGLWSDVWSLGCVLVEILGEQHPLPWAECGNQAQILSAILVEQRGPKVPGGFPVRIQAVLERALFLAPHARPEASALLQELQELSRA